MAESINCIVETPKGYGVKYDYDSKLARMELRKVLPAGLVFPFDFGYIPGTLGEDGDPLDVIMISEVPAFPGCAVKCRIIGAIKARQRELEGDEMRNDRFLAIPDVSVMYKHIQKTEQLPDAIIEEIQQFFINYNQQAGKRFRPLALISAPAALKIIQKAQENPAPSKLVQLLLPLYDKKGQPFPQRHFEAIKNKFIKEFGGVTIYTQSPASGIWQDESKKVAVDKVMIFEVMVGRIDRSFWESFKDRLQQQFKQKEIVIRQTEIGLL